MHRRLGLAVVLVSVAGCPSPPDISKEIEEYGDLLASTYSLTCECHSDLGYASQPECGDALGVVGPVRRDCMADALEDEDDAKAFLDCANLAMRNFELCLEDNVTAGCIEGQYYVCSDAFDAELAECPSVSALDNFLTCGSI